MDTRLDPADHVDFDDLTEWTFNLPVVLDRAGEYDLLREFTVYIGCDLIGQADGSGLIDVGTMSGWYSRVANSGALADVGDSISGDAFTLALAAQEIIERDMFYEEVLLIDRITLNKEWRGHKIMRHLVERVVGVLQCDPSLTIAVVYPEPLALDGSGRLEDGPDRDAGMTKLLAACRAGGFRPWDDGTVWWRGFDPIEID